jgi:hypothetical protein
MDATAVRDWARENGYDVGTRGRIKDEIVTAYILANGVPAEEPPKPARSASSPQTQAVPEKTVLVARPLASPGVAESYGPDPKDIRDVAKVYVPGAGDLTEELIVRARSKHAAIVNVGGELKLYRDHVIPDNGAIVLDWRERKPEGSR